MLEIEVTTLKESNNYPTLVSHRESNLYPLVNFTCKIRYSNLEVVRRELYLFTTLYQRINLIAL